MIEPPPTAEEIDAAIEFLGIACCETQVIDRVALLLRALAPFVDLIEVETNGYKDSPDNRVVCSVGTLGRDYAFVTVGDLRRARRIVRGEV
jgi:hypothetical protein